MLTTPCRWDHLGNGYLDWYAPMNVFHPGVDLNYGSTPGADLGDPILCPADGVVIFVSPTATQANQYGGGLGNYTITQHPQLSVWCRFMHQQSIMVKAGDKLTMGQQIGTVGGTGTTEPHLHFEVMNAKGFAYIQT